MMVNYIKIYAPLGFRWHYVHAKDKGLSYYEQTSPFEGGLKQVKLPPEYEYLEQDQQIIGHQLIKRDGESLYLLRIKIDPYRASTGPEYFLKELPEYSP